MDAYLRVGAKRGGGWGIINGFAQERVCGMCHVGNICDPRKDFRNENRCRRLYLRSWELNFSAVLEGQGMLTTVVQKVASQAGFRLATDPFLDELCELFANIAGTIQSIQFERSKGSVRALGNEPK